MNNFKKINKLGLCLIFVFILFFFLSYANNIYADDEKVNNEFSIKNIKITEDDVSGLPNQIEGGKDSKDLILEKEKIIVLGLNGLVMLFSLIFFIIRVTQLQIDSTNPNIVQENKKAIVVSLIVTAFSGSFMLILSYAWNLLK